MNEELQNKAVEIITAIQDSIGKAGEFAMVQLPDIAQQYVIYGRVKSVIVLLAFATLSFALLTLARWAYKFPWYGDAYGKERRAESNYTVLVFSTGIGALCGLFAFLSFDLLVWFAPKVWLLKELSTLFK